MDDNISLKDFVQKFLPISKRFIDKYFKFYDACENDKFGINVEDIIIFLKINKTEIFYKRLRKNYIEHLDYIVKYNNNKATKNIKLVEYFVTFITFEKICLMSRTEEADKVRDYFIKLRQFVDYYKNHIKNMIYSSKFGAIYIILVNKNKNIFKIGRTDKAETKERFMKYVTGYDKHPDIQFIILVDDPQNIEKCTKFFTKEYRYRKHQELYKIDYDILKSEIINCVYNDAERKKLKEMTNVDSYIMYNNTKITKKSSKKNSKKKSKKLSNKKMSNIKQSKKSSINKQFKNLSDKNNSTKIYKNSKKY